MTIKLSEPQIQVLEWVRESRRPRVAAHWIHTATLAALSNHNLVATYLELNQEHEVTKLSLGITDLGKLMLDQHHPIEWRDALKETARRRREFKRHAKTGHSSPR